MRAQLTKFAVPVAQQDALVAKSKANTLWDANTAASPVSRETKVIGEEDYSISRYRDGSVRAMGLERAVPASDFSTQ